MPASVVGSITGSKPAGAVYVVPSQKPPKFIGPVAQEDQPRESSRP